MILVLCSIQRDRAPWIVEWLAFHYVVGFRKFYFYAHHCTDDTCDILRKLTTVLDLKAFEIRDIADFVQLQAYQNAYDSFGHEVDWMAFIDGDEFLFPTQADTLQDVLKDYHYQRLSALGAYWVCFGSNGHIEEPSGLIVDNYTRRPEINIRFNHHIKSIVMGRQSVSANKNAHLFTTQFGTFDELMRPIDKGYMIDTTPTYEKLRINHYICQSYNYFKKFKQFSGSADAGHAVARPDTWWTDRDFNDVYDDAILRFRAALVEKVDELEDAIARFP